MGMHTAFPKVNEVKKLIKKNYQFLAVGTDMTFLGEICRYTTKQIKKK